MNKPVGKIIFYGYKGSSETVEYMTADDYLKAIDDAYNCLGINGWKYITLSDDPELRRKIKNRAASEFGYDEEDTP